MTALRATGDGSFLKVSFHSIRSRLERLRLYVTIDPSYHFFSVVTSHKFIMGDLNADVTSGADSDAHTIRNLAKNLNLKVVQHVPTHPHTPNSYT